MGKILVLLMVLIGGLIVFEPDILGKIFLPCRKPIEYTIGTLDKRFNITRQSFIDALSEAEAIWEKSLGRELFVYTPEGANLDVNLVYDYRQETTSTLEELGQVVEENEASYRTLQSRYARLKADYENAKNTYARIVEEFNTASDAYEKKVEAWNNGPRTSKSQFKGLEDEKNALQIRLSELRSAESSLNRMAQEINMLVVSLNRFAIALNLDVETYNTIGAKRGESFTGGIYYNTEEGEGIDIYEFSSRDKLVRILAHELGHALGLEHLEDSKAIMYYLNQGNARLLTESDLTSLKTLCRVE